MNAAATTLTLLAVCWFAATPTSGADDAMRLDPSDLLVKIEWYGAVSKPVHEAAFATTNRYAELRTWRKAWNQRYRRTSTISATEVISLDEVFSKMPAFKNGPVTLPQYEQRYLLTLASKGREWHTELPFSRTILPLLDSIKNCLKTDSQEPIQLIIEQASKWQN